MAAVTKNRNFFSCQFPALLQIKMNSNFNCSYMAMSSLTYILGFSVSSLGGPLSKLCVTPPFSINLICQIENQVCDYRLLEASSFYSGTPF